MLVLDENLPEGQRLWLRKWRIRFRAVGIEVAASGTKDSNLIPYDHEIRLFLRFLMKFVIGSGLERAPMNHFKARGILSGFCCALWSSSRSVAGAN